MSNYKLRTGRTVGTKVATLPDADNNSLSHIRIRLRRRSLRYGDVYSSSVVEKLPPTSTDNYDTDSDSSDVIFVCEQPARKTPETEADLLTSLGLSLSDDDDDIPNKADDERQQISPVLPTLQTSRPRIIRGCGRFVVSLPKLPLKNSAKKTNMTKQIPRKKSLAKIVRKKSIPTKVIPSKPIELELIPIEQTPIENELEKALREWEAQKRSRDLYFSKLSSFEPVEPLQAIRESVPSVSSERSPPPVVCNEPVQNPPQLFRLVAGDDGEKCQFCDFICDTSTTMQDHNYQNHPFKCTWCELRFNSRAALAKHRRTHVNQHYCLPCGRPFLKFSSLNVHMMKDRRHGELMEAQREVLNFMIDHFDLTKYGLTKMTEKFVRADECNDSPNSDYQSTIGCDGQVLAYLKRSLKQSKVAVNGQVLSTNQNSIRMRTMVDRACSPIPSFEYVSNVDASRLTASEMMELERISLPTSEECVEQQERSEESFPQLPPVPLTTLTVDELIDLMNNFSDEISCDQTNFVMDTGTSGTQNANTFSETFRLINGSFIDDSGNKIN